MVVAAPDHDLRVGAVADAVADDAAVAEIEYAAVDRLQLTGRDQRRVDGRIGRGGDGQLVAEDADGRAFTRSEEHTSELQSLMRISYAVFCLKKKKNKKDKISIEST